ncbi:threonine synthase [Winogradskyella aquimaris]|uniref:Threonine synthase n=1 Tax=Winogradskyella aquimaris TaxID=864074 RepID=A0ABU5ELY8_9FLAO|nr:threonine synthase [Winogradskyella aquimaris]MDY2587308.1 threonine synthase [Winogradskyella aquimaris]
MTYYSLNHNAPDVSFEEAVVRGLAPDKGLYFPKKIERLSDSFFQNIENLDNVSIAFEVIAPFVGNEIPKNDLKKILKDVLNFDFPLVEIDKNITALELFHGPTMAFKDVGARFMARCLGYFNNKNNNKDNITVLVATSGDTGGAVAHGFLGVKGVDVIILYPSGKVSNIQEKQLTTLGQNITALEVNGVFDDCQAMVKTAFLDQNLKTARTLTSANSINVARWLPQMFYYFFAYKALKHKGKNLVFSVPSGNYGNICAGMMAQKLGLPIHHFVTGTNANSIIPDYLKTGNYKTKTSVSTISNAMDVGDPSNFIRIEELHDHNFDRLKQNLSGYSFNDAETVKAINYLKIHHNYVADPHGAIGYLALKTYLNQNLKVHGVFLETAHPIKFLPVMPKDIVDNMTIPSQIKSILNKEKKSIKISTYQELTDFLIN